MKTYGIGTKRFECCDTRKEHRGVSRDGRRYRNGANNHPGQEHRFKTRARRNGLAEIASQAEG